MEAQKQLTDLMAHQLLGEAKRSATYDSLQELKDALARIRQEYKLLEQEKELAALTSIEYDQLSEQQKHRHRELVILKLQTKLTRH